MAFQSRAATFYANTSYAGLYNASAYVGLNGSDVTSSVVDDSFETIIRDEESARIAPRWSTPYISAQSDPVTSVGRGGQHR